MAFNNNTTTTGATGAAHKPTIGEKISGTVDSLVGKVTNNPTKVAEGEAKKHGEPVTGAAAGLNQAAHGHSTTGTGSGLTGSNHGTGLTGTHDHSHTGTGTGLTGTHSTGTGLTGNHGHSTGTGLTGNHHAGQPTFGDKVAGEKDQLVGRATNNPAQYAQGEARAGEYGNTGTGYGASTGTGLTGNHGHSHTTGTGLTGDHSHSHSHGTGLTGNHSHGTGLTGTHDSTALGGVAGTHGTHGTHGAHGTHGSGLTGDNYGSSNYGNTGTHTGSGVGRNAGYEHGQPTMGDKLSGGVDTLVGKATSNPAKVAEGEAKRTGDPAHAQAAAANTGTDSYGNHQTGPGSGNYAGNTTTTRY